MKKILLTILFVIILSGQTFADKRNWVCDKIGNNTSKCISDRISGNFKIKEIYVGETTNNLPSGNGKITFEINGEKIDDYAKGFFVLDNNDYLVLDTGEQYVDNNIYFKKNLKLYKTQYFNGEIFEGTYYEKTSYPKKGTFKANNGDVYKGTFTKDGKYLSGTNYFKDGKKIKYKNSEKIKSFEKTNYILFIIPLILFIVYKLIKGNKINSNLSKITDSSKIYLKEKGFKTRGDFSIVIILIIVLGPGTLILISWLSKKLLGIYAISEFVDSIFNIDFFIVFIYLLLSTMASILWWGYLILEKLFSKKHND